jgi:hypothetical protein
MVMYRLIQFYGYFGASMKRLEGNEHKCRRIRPILAQLEQCLVFCQHNFEEDSLEMKSIRELYEYELENMAVSKRVVMLVDDESVEDNLQDLETAYPYATSGFFDTVPDSLKEDVMPPARPQSAKEQHI